MRKTKREEFLKLQESRKKIEVIIPLKTTQKENFSSSELDSEKEEISTELTQNSVDLEMDMETASEL